MRAMGIRSLHLAVSRSLRAPLSRALLFSRLVSSRVAPLVSLALALALVSLVSLFSRSRRPSLLRSLSPPRLSFPAPLAAPLLAGATPQEGPMSQHLHAHPVEFSRV